MFNPVVPYQTPWRDQRRHSWWQALLVIIVYFAVRIPLEAQVLIQGTVNAGIDVKESLTVEGTLYALSQNQWGYFLKEVILFVGVVLVIRLFKLKLFDLQGVTAKRIRHTVGFFFIVYLIQVVFNFLVLIFAPEYTAPANQQLIEMMSNQMNPLLMFFTIVIAAPVIEEILFRGLVMKYMFGPLPILGALVASAGFALLHSPANWIDFTSYFILSAGLTFVYWHTRKLEYAIQFHMMQNLIAFVGLQLL